MERKACIEAFISNNGKGEEEESWWLEEMRTMVAYPSLLKQTKVMSLKDEELRTEITRNFLHKCSPTV